MDCRSGVPRGVLETGRRFRVFNVEDQLTREGLAAEVDTSLPGPRVARTLDRIVAERGKPKMIVSDNGTELITVLDVVSAYNDVEGLTHLQYFSSELFGGGQ